VNRRKRKPLFHNISFRSDHVALFLLHNLGVVRILVLLRLFNHLAVLHSLAKHIQPELLCKDKVRDDPRCISNDTEKGRQGAIIDVVWRRGLETLSNHVFCKVGSRSASGG